MLLDAILDCVSSLKTVDVPVVDRWERLEVRIHLDNINADNIGNPSLVKAMNTDSSL